MNHNATNQRSKQKINWLFAAPVILVAGIALALYFSQFNGMLSDSSGAWGTFGDYFGGLVNPVVGIVTVFLVLQTLQVTRQEADVTRQEMQKQTAHLELQAAQAKRDQKLNELQKVSDGLLVEWKTRMDRQNFRVISIFEAGRLYDQAFSTAGSFFYGDTSKKALQNIKGTNLFVELQAQWQKAAKAELRILREMADCCAAYEQIAEDRTVPDFYRRRVMDAAVLMHGAGLLSEKELEMLTAPVHYGIAFASG